MLDSTVVLESGGVGLICRATLRCRALILEPTYVTHRHMLHTDICFFIKELNKYNNKIMGQSNIMKYLMQKAT